MMPYYEDKAPRPMYKFRADRAIPQVAPSENRAAAAY
jgi:hypothetical protein